MPSDKGWSLEDTGCRLVTYQNTSVMVIGQGLPGVVEI